MPNLVMRRCAAFAVALSLLTAAAAAQADFLTANIDRTANPADDFFQYANGGWLKRNPIAPTESSNGIYILVRDELNRTLRRIHEQAVKANAPAGSDEQKIGDFWRTALDETRARKQGVTPLKAELKRIDAIKTHGDVIDATFALVPIADVLFGVEFEPDRVNSDTIAFWAEQGGLGLPERDFYVNPSKDIAAIRAAYVKYQATLLQLLGRGAADARKSATAVMAFETELAKASRKLEDLRDPLKNYNPFKTAEVTAKFTPSIDWAQKVASWQVQPESMVLGQPEYFAALDKIVAATPVPVLKDYLRLRLVDAYAEHLSPAFENAHFDFHNRTLNGQKQPRPRWKRALEAEGGFGTAANPLGMLVGKQYVAQYFPERAKQRYAAMTRAVVDAYAARIKTLSWMTDATKARALEKLAALNPKVGYPDRWADTSNLAIGRESHAANMMAITRWRFDFARARFGKPVDRGEWFMTPQTYNAYYNPANNEIVLPAAGFVIPGVKDDDIDDAVAYSYAGGSTIGHELTHGFDDGGRKFDPRGNLTDWWSAEDAAAFEQRSQVLVAQFNHYEPLPGFHINGKASLGENIADLGGLAIALDAFKKTEQFKNGTPVAGQTPMQRYFLGWALAWMSTQRTEQLRSRLLSDVHAPAKWRVLGPVSNLPEFHDAFGVTPKNKMWRAPEERASVW